VIMELKFEINILKFLLPWLLGSFSAFQFFNPIFRGVYLGILILVFIYDVGSW
jgi:hypothetical protein